MLLSVDCQPKEAPKKRPID